MYSDKILIFHSNSRYVEKISTLLKNSGFSTILANDKDTAYQLTIAMNPNLILWGEALTSKNKSTIEKIKNSSNGNDISIIAIAHNLELFDRIEAQKYGVDDFFQDHGDYSDLKSKIRFHLDSKKQINYMHFQVNRYKDLSDVTFSIILSQDILDICDIAVDYIQKSFNIDSLVLVVYNTVVKVFDYFRIENSNKISSISIDSIKEDKFWQKYCFSNGKIKSEQITEKSILNKFKSWKITNTNIYQFPLEYKNGNSGILFISFKNDEYLDSKDSLLLDMLCKAIGNRISELRRLFGTKRGEDSQNLVSRDLFHRLTEEEIFIHVTKTLIKILHANIGLYISYNEGFRFLFPKYSFKSNSKTNLFQNEKPPVLLLKEFPSFDYLLNQKGAVLLHAHKEKLGNDIKKLPGFKNISLENIIIFPLIIENAVQGFFVLGKQDSIKKYTNKESTEGDRLIHQATDVLLENRILKKAKLTIKQLDRIFDISTEITLDVPLKDILKKICTAIRRTLGWNIVIIDMKDRYDDKFKMVSILGLKDADHQRYINNTNYPPFELRLEKSFKINNSFFFDYFLSKSEDFESAKNNFKSRLGSEWNDKDWLYVPIESRGELLGMISLNDPVDRVKPTEDRIKSVEYFANQAAVAMENTQLFDSLKSSQLKYRLLAETMTMGLVTCDFDGKIIYINQSLVKILKYESAEDLLGKSIYYYCDVNGAKDLEIESNSILNDEKQINFDEASSGLEIELLDSDKESIPFHMYLSPFYEQNKKIGFFGVLSDLRNQKKLERMKSDFNSMIVHDLRSPLNIIQGYVDIVRTQVIGKISDEQAELLTIAKENVYKVLKLIDNFLIASKIEVGKFEIETEINSINSLIETLFEHYQILANKKNIKLEIQLDQNLPLLNFDKFRIEQVLTNFLSNAIKFTPKDGQIVIASKLVQKKSKITGDVNLKAKISVTDSGVGIVESEKNKVFNKYEQTEAGKNALLKGTGLGLAISREIVQLHNGEIGVKSKVDEGSTFYFTLPINPVVI